MTEAEALRVVLDATAAILRRAEVTEDDHFLEVGGSSLAAIHLVDKLNRQLGLDLSPLAPFETETLGGLARLCAAQASG
jgi:acyl carrier protein